MLKVLLCVISVYAPPKDTLPLIDSNQVLERVAAFYEQEQYGEAAALLRQVSPYDSNFLAAQGQLIYALNADGRSSDAIEVGMTLIQSQSHLSSNIYVQLGNALVQDDQVIRGLMIYQQGLEQFPYNHYLLYNAGYAHYRLDEVEEAITYFQEVAKIRPFYSRVHQMLGNILSRTKYRTKAALSYMTYLAIEPEENWALVRLNDLMNESLREEGSLQLDLDNCSMEYYDNLLRSKAAFDDRYKSDIDFQAPVAQQNELLINQLKYVPGTGDFWMDFYVAYLQKIANEGLTTAFVYFMLYSSGNEDILAWLEKHQKEKDAWIDITNDLLTDNKLLNVRTIGDSTRQYQHWYYSEGGIQAIGMENAARDNIGPYEFYHENGRLQARGTYDHQGRQIGVWEYFFDTGVRQSRREYDEEGRLTGRAVYYSESGEKRSEGDFKEGEIDGPYHWYHDCGTLSEVYPYVDGVGQGEGKLYYETGQVRAIYQVSDDELEGEYVSYYKVGEVKDRTTYRAGQKDGPYQSYYIDGTLHEKGQYQDDEASGTWEFYHANGELNSRGAFANGKRTGEWLYFYANKEPMRSETYNADGDLQGLTIWYDRDGIKHAERTYESGMLVGYMYFDKKGSVLSEAADPDGNMPMVSYYASGEKWEESTLEGGKLSGPRTTYFLNGKVYQKGTMKDADWHGDFEQFIEQGMLEYATTYESGSIDGYYRSFHPNGEVSTEGWIKEDNIQQTWHKYYLDGSLKERSYYSEGELQGPTAYFSSQGQLMREDLFEDGVLVGINQYDSLGNLYHQTHFPRGTGDVELRFASGQLKYTSERQCGEDKTDAVFYYRTGEKESAYVVEHGESKRFEHYAHDGTLLTKGGYRDGSRFGEWSFFFDDGALDARYTYDANGQIEGASYDYYENGQEESVCEYHEGEREGPCRYYDISGQLQMVKMYARDEGATSYQYEVAPGQLSDAIIIPEVGEVRVEAFFANGAPSIIQSYKDGVYHGKLQKYYAGGALHKEFLYDRGFLEQTEIYYQDGQLKTSIRYDYGSKYGKELHYYRSGTTKEEIDWFEDDKHGWHRKYDENGAAVFEEYYWHGKAY